MAQKLVQPNLLASGLSAQYKVAKGKTLTTKEAEAYRSMAEGRTRQEVLARETLRKMERLGLIDLRDGKTR